MLLVIALQQFPLPGGVFARGAGASSGCGLGGRRCGFAKFGVGGDRGGGAWRIWFGGDHTCKALVRDGREIKIAQEQRRLMWGGRGVAGGGVWDGGGVGGEQVDAL